MKLEILETQGVAQPQGLYNHAISVSAGRLLFIAGQVAIDADNQLVGPGDFNAQMQQVFKNLGSILDSAGASFENIVKFTTYLIRSQDLSAFYNKRREIFAEIYPNGRYPTNTLVVIDQLAREEWLIEIEAVAALP
ncbi:MAG: RidA family protein [Desulfobacterales bacterium]|nr:MAG: RidA family protein [Desulfobacterales bacterium]